MKRLLVAGMVMGLGLAAVPARADTESEAREAYRQGRTLYKEGKYAEAVLALKRAYELKPHPALLRYMGDSYYKMNDARKAIQHYKLYLSEAPQAADRDKVESRVKELELIVGEDTAPPPAPAPAPVPAPAPAPAPVPAPAPAPTGTTPPPTNIDMAPTGDDTEVPLALRQKRAQMEAQRQQQQQDSGTSALTVMKWLALGVGVGGLALGITFNRLAAGNASDLESAVTDSGNTDGKSPKIPFAEEHFQLQQDYKRNQSISIAGWVVGGVGVATSIILFVVDRDKPERRAPVRTGSVGVAPVVGAGVYGLTGQVTF
jgi:tetratricopeptide (TPR) repeat protein